jgi:RNA polymerase sigma factor (sigma-70 family)
MPEACQLPEGSLTLPPIESSDSPNPDGLGGLTDDELYGRYVDGCKRSFAVLFHRHNDSIVRRLVIRYRFTHSTADDVAQQVWIRAASYKDCRSFAAVLNLLTRSTAINTLTTWRRKVAKLEKHKGQEWRLSDVTSDDFERLYDQSPALHRAIEALSPEYRAAIKYVYFDGFSIRDAAKRCGVSPSTFQGRLDRAKEEIKTALV